MPLYDDGQHPPVNLSEQDYCKRLIRDVSWLEQGAIHTYTNHKHGLPDFQERDQIIVQLIQGWLTSLVPQIEDEEIREMFQAICQLSLRMRVEIDRQLVACLARYVNQALPQTQQEGEQLEETITEHRYKNTIDWVPQDYPQILQQLRAALSELQLIKQRLDEKLVQNLIKATGL